MIDYTKLEDCNNNISQCISSLRVMRTALDNPNSVMYQNTIIEALMLIESELEKNCKLIEELIEKAK